MKTAQIIILIAALLLLTGCAHKEYLTINERLVMSEGEGTMTEDTRIPEEHPIEHDTYSKDEFIDAFISFWRKGDYGAIYELLSDTQGLSKQEFVFLARNAAEAEQIQNISLCQQENNIMKFQIYTTAYLKKIPTEMIKTNNGWLFSPFYIFTDLSPEKVCADRSNTVTLDECGLTIENPDKTRCKMEKRKSCFFEYANVSGNAEYCNMTANLRGACLVQLGFTIDLNQTITDCYAFPTESEQATCLLELARGTRDKEVCRRMIFERTKYECYGMMAAFGESVLKCEEFIKQDGFYNSFRHALCVLSYVKETGDTSQCEQIHSSDDAMVGAMREECSEMRFG
ncbi:MAG: hypothetical protein KJ574_00975 [Nanoarchaeota archaeon]|nr:hypothetical protein [Nanoarchaeota archaeon]